MDSGDNIDNVYVITDLGIGQWTLIWLSTTAWPLVAAQTTKFSMALGGSSMVQHKHPNGPKWQYEPWTSTQSQTAVRPRTQILYLAETQGWQVMDPSALFLIALLLLVQFTTACTNLCTSLSHPFFYLILCIGVASPCDCLSPVSSQGTRSCDLGLIS